MKSSVQVFKGSINDVQDIINDWAAQNHVTILNATMCYDEHAALVGQVFVIVVYTVE